MWRFYSTALRKWSSGAQPALSPGVATCKWWIIRNIKNGIELKKSLHYSDPATACSGGTWNVNVLWRNIYAASTVTNFQVDIIALKHNAKQKSKQIFCAAGIVKKKHKEKLFSLKISFFGLPHYYDILRPPLGDGSTGRVAEPPHMPPPPSSASSCNHGVPSNGVRFLHPQQKNPDSTPASSVSEKFFSGCRYM